MFTSISMMVYGLAVGLAGLEPIRAPARGTFIGGTSAKFHFMVLAYSNFYTNSVLEP